MADQPTVAVLGAGGVMGSAMARNLAAAEFDVRAWNRSAEKAAPLTEHGIEVLDSPAQAVEGADIIVTMLADAEAVLESMQGDAGALAASRSDQAVWLQMSTIGEAGTDACVDLARQHRLAFVDAPVLGTKQPAEEGKLVILAAGPEELRDRVEAIFDVIGQRTMWVGQAGAGTRLKLVTNSWIVAVVEGGAETFALAEAMGVDPALFLEAIEGGALDLPYLRMKGQAMMQRKFEPSFRLALAAKDAALVEESAQRHQVDLPVISAIRQRLEQGVPEHGDEDMSATFLTSAPAG